MLLLLYNLIEEKCAENVKWKNSKVPIIMIIVVVIVILTYITLTHSNELSKYLTGQIARLKYSKWKRAIV